MERAAELSTRTRRDGGEGDLLAKIAEMSEPDRGMVMQLHKIIRANAPELSPKTWYGMPAYINKDGNVACHFQCAQKFKMRCSTLGFSDKSNLDEGKKWPVAFALKELTPAVESQIASLLKKAVE